MINRNDDCWCGSGRKWKKCHFPKYPSSEEQESFDERAKVYFKRWGILLKTPQQIDGIRKAGHLAAHILDEVCEYAKEGVTTNELDIIAYNKIVKAGAIPASLHYGSPPFPKSICTSLNEVICHGIPDSTPLRKGDIVNVDLAVILDGYFGDCSKMVAIGPVCADKKRVFDVSLESLKASAKILKPGLPIFEIGTAISDVAERAGCSVVTQYVGHGCGLRYHEPPQVPHCRNPINIVLVPGMIFTIEPMINFGVPDAVVDAKDHWTARTKDCKPSAQWEYQFLITNTGAEILTPWKETHCVLKT